MTLELVSFKLCPFVQRSIILLLEKNVSYNVTYIELDKKPKWFMRLSPTGKVPILMVGKEVLFESSVINEYLDETNPPRMHPAVPLVRARNRAWIEYSSKLMMEQHKLLLSKDEDEFNSNLDVLRESFRNLELNIRHKPFFNGSKFSLVDAAFAPSFMRLNYINDLVALNLYSPKSRVATWVGNLLKRKSVKLSVVPEFFNLLNNRIKNSDGYLSAIVNKSRSSKAKK